MADLNLSILDAIRTVEHSPHTLNGASVLVLLYDEFEDENPDDFNKHTVGEDGCSDENDIIIIVSGLFPSTSKDAVVNYFENSRRSGGGEVSNFHYTDEGEAIITFLEVKGMCHTVAGMALPGFPCGYEKCAVLSKGITTVFIAKRLSKSKHFFAGCISSKQSGFTFTAKNVGDP